VLAPDGSADDAPHVAEFIAHLRRHRGRAARIFAGFVAAALVIAALLPPRYYASATLAVLPAPEFTVRQDAGSRATSTSALAMDQVMKAETAILESDSLHGATLDALGVAVIYPGLDPAAPRSWFGAVVHGVASVVLAPWRVTPADRAAALREAALQQFAGDLTVLPAKDANVIDVRFHNKDGAVAAQAINTMLSRYAARRSRLYDDPQLGVVRGQTDEAAREVAAADAALAAFKAAHLITDFAGERDLRLRRQSDTAQALSAALSAAAEQHARWQALNQQIARLPRAVPLYNEADTDTRLLPIDTALVELRGRLATAREQYRDTSRKVTDLQASITAREAERRRLAADAAPSLARAGRSQALDPLLVDRAHAASDAAASEARVAALRDDLADQAAALARLAADETALTDLTRRRAAAADNFASASHVQDEQRMTEAEDSLRLANVRVIQAALTPQRPAPIPLLVVVAGILLGGFAACFWLVARFVIRPTFFTPEGLHAATGLTVLAVFPAREDALVE
jgi:uncharacterized protein involved in exopolysaccharide biosynthesis